MKKLFLSFLLLATVAGASAQLKSNDIKIYMRGTDTGLGAGITYGIGQNMELSPSFSYYFPAVGQIFTADVDFHYLLTDIAPMLDIYPLGGVGLLHQDQSDYHLENPGRANMFLLNVGGGARYHFHAEWAVTIEEKFQLSSNDNSNNLLSVGISYTF